MVERHQIAISKKAMNGIVNTLFSKRFCLHLVIAILVKINPKNEDISQLKNIVLDLAHLKIKMGLVGNDVIPMLKKAIKDIIGSPVEFEDDRYWTVVPFIEAPLLDKQTRLITVSVNECFLPHIVNLKNFLELKERILGASSRAILFYAAIKSVHAKTVYQITPEELQLACRVQYSDFGNFKAKFLTPVIAELASCNIFIDFQEHKLGQRVDYLSFTIKEPALPADRMPEIDLHNSVQMSRVEATPDTDIPTTASIKSHKSNEVLENFRTIMKKSATHKFFNEDHKLVITALNTFTLEELKKAITAFSQDTWEERPKHSEVKDLFKNNQVIQKWVNAYDPKAKPPSVRRTLTDEEFKAKVKRDFGEQAEEMLRTGKY